MNPYRIKHKPTGLYFSPGWCKTNLSFKGKVYKSKLNVLDYYWDGLIPIVIYRKSKVAEVCKKLIPVLNTSLSRFDSCKIMIATSDFEIEYL